MMTSLQANTERVEYADRGMFHAEGGWPKEVNQDDPEQVVRYRKKAEKEDLYLQCFMRMSEVSLAYYPLKNFNKPKTYIMQDMLPNTFLKKT